MAEWEFKRLGAGAITELTPKQILKIPDYVAALEVAKESRVANPVFSKYFVREGIGVAGDEILPAGNIEYGMHQALHGEESAVAAFRSEYGRGGTRNLILGIIAENPGGIPNPCGNCRDIMRDELGEDFEIVSGSKEGRLAVVSKMSDFLFDNFQTINPVYPDYEGINKKFIKGLALINKEGSKLENNAYGPEYDKNTYNKYERRNYKAAVATENNYYIGALDVMSDYHPIYALTDAVRQARRANDPYIRFVLISAGLWDIPPDVMYKDRQHLLELNLQQELVMGKEVNPPVYMDGGAIWVTSVKQWLPYPFSARNFTDLEELTKYYKLKSLPPAANFPFYSS